MRRYDCALWRNLLNLIRMHATHWQVSKLKGSVHNETKLICWCLESGADPENVEPGGANIINYQTEPGAQIYFLVLHIRANRGCVRRMRPPLNLRLRIGSIMLYIVSNIENNLNGSSIKKNMLFVNMTYLFCDLTHVTSNRIHVTHIKYLFNKVIDCVAIFMHGTLQWGCEPWSRAMKRNYFIILETSCCGVILS